MGRKKTACASLFAAAVTAITTVGQCRADVTGFGGFAPVNLSGPYHSPALYSPDGSTFQLTDGDLNEVASGFYPVQQNISSFTTSFTYTCVGGDGQQYSQADGFSFVIQDDPRGTTAIGQSGGDLGVGGTGAISPSAEFEFNLYRTQGVSRFLLNGAISSSFNTPGVVLNNGHPFNITLGYYGSYATATLVDTVTNQVFTSYPDTGTLPISTYLHSTNAFVGFTGATGGNGSIQQITNFKYKANLNFTPITATGWNQDMVVEATAPQSGAINRVTATMDSGTAKTGYTFEQIGYDPNHPSDGLPAPGVVFSSDQGSAHQYVMQSYTADNAVLVDALTTTATMNFSTPASYSALSFLCASGHGPNDFLVTLHYADGAAPVTLEVAAPDWYFNSPSGFATLGRVAPSTGASVFDHYGSYPALLSEDLLLPNTDAISSLTITYVSGNANGEVAIFAVSGNPAAAVPEPVGLTAIIAGAVTLFGRRGRRSSPLSLERN